MIFVITGMEVHPFDRLLQKIDELVSSGQLTDEVFVQRGHTPYEPKHVPFENFLSFGEVCERIEGADVVITHAGAGSTLTCLQCKKRPISIPRLPQFGEHVDDHQLPFSQKLHDFGLVRQVLEMDDLLEAIHELKGQGEFVREGESAASGIVNFLDGFWDETAKRKKS